MSALSHSSRMISECSCHKLELTVGKMGQVLGVDARHRGVGPRHKRDRSLSSERGGAGLKIGPMRAQGISPLPSVGTGQGGEGGEDAESRMAL
jgi:hypothetical protein